MRLRRAGVRLVSALGDTSWMSLSAVRALTKAHTNGTGWAMTGVVDKKSGFHLEDISHDGHWFADSISVERIAVASFSDLDYRRSRDNSKNYHVFGLGDCKVVSAPEVVTLPTGTTDPLGYYAPRVKLAASYRMPDLLQEKWLSSAQMMRLDSL
ncbi:hypothetical protein [Nonomuraea recticatena]|uniref:Uncharacterized protein n=1 Tax=Nonomuraea recticatena TaxID=46178 RepID=A0ABP6F0D3_9ACTN